MTDIRKRLADELYAGLIDHGMLVQNEVEWEDMANNLADILLSLPGIAIVEVPGGDFWDAIDLLIELAGPRAFATAAQAQEEQ